MKTAVADTSFLIAISNRGDAHHATAIAWLEALEHRHVIVHIPAIALAEFSIRGDFNALMEMGDFLAVDFSQDDAVECAKIIEAWDARKSSQDKPTSRTSLKDDIKILATAKRLKATHLITADDRQMTKIAKALEICRVIPCDRPVDKSFFNKDGHPDLPMDDLPDEPVPAPKKRRKH